MAELILYAGQLAWLILAPLHLLTLWLAAGAALLYAPKPSWRMTGRTVVTIGVLFAVIIATVPIGSWGVAMLENRFPQPQLPRHVAGIIVLGGGEQQRIAATRGAALSGNGTMDRLLNFKILAGKYPDAMLIYSGGTTQDAMRETMRQAGIARITLEAMSLTRPVIYEDKSRNTHENAAESAAIAGAKKAEPWILVTSAWHMPRAVGAFRKQGWNVIAFPVDYNTPGGKNDVLHIGFGANLDALNAFMRESIGLAGYWLTGRSDALFPGPA